MIEQSELQIFISYATADRDRILPIYEFLIVNGYPNTWIDCKKLLPGQPWDYEIKRNLRKSEIVLIFLSSNSVDKRGYVQRELKIATKYLEEKLEGDIYVIPIKLDANVPVPELLNSVQYLNFSDSDSLNLLLESLNLQRENLGLESFVKDDLDEIHCIKRTFKEAWEGIPGYEVEFSWPELHSTKYKNVNEISRIIEANLISRVQLQRLDKLEQDPSMYSWSQPDFQRTNTFEASFDDVIHINNYFGINYLASWYGAGAAHPNYYFDTYNFFLNPLIQMKNLEDCFINSESALVDIQKKTREILFSNASDSSDAESNQTEDQKLFLDLEWVTSGTDKWQDFNAFTFNDAGLVVNFAPYSIGPYAAGPFTVVIPYSVFSSNLKSEYAHALNVPNY